MGKQISGVEISFLLRELKKLEGGRVQKIYNKGDDFCMNIYTGKEQYLSLLPGKGLFLGEIEHDKTPSNFCMVLRKHLRNSRIIKIEQKGLERIVKMHFHKGDEYVLVLEIMRPGNLILLKDKEIIFPLKIRKYGSRWVKPKELYEPPPLNKDVMDFKESEMKDVVRFLAVDVGLGGKYAEEICKRAHIDKNLAMQELDKQKAEKLQKILEKFLSKEIDPRIWDNHLMPTKMKTLPSKGKEYKSLSRAVQEYLKQKKQEEQERQPKKHLKEKIEKRVSELENKAANARQKAEDIMRDFDSIQAVFRGVKRAVDEYGWSRTKELLKNHSGPEVDRITNIFPDQNKIIVSDNIELYLDQSLGDNMNNYYEEAKKYEAKALSAKRKKSSIVRKARKKPKKKKKPRKEKGWHTKFRHFISSQGFLVVSGKSAQQNEELIKKYMEQEDLVFHADVHGSPFTLVKQGRKSSEKTRKEAAQQTASYSRAWDQGLGFADVYYIMPHQVSLEAPSGEYLSKGSFMIKGKKNIMKNVKLELAIGFSDKVLSGPKSAVRKKTHHYVIIYPGKNKREEVAQDIINILEKGVDYDIPVDHVVKTLPGRCRIWSAYK